MFDPITIGVGALLWFAFKKQSNTQFGVLTPEREEVYKNAMEYCQDPVKLRQLAGDFEKEGLKAEAFWMRKRADWRGRTPEKKAEHDAIFKKAMESTNINAITEVAKAFESLTATFKAAQLKQRVNLLKANQANQLRNEILAESAADRAEHETVVMSEEKLPNVVETTVEDNGMSRHTPPETPSVQSSTQPVAKA